MKPTRGSKVTIEIYARKSRGPQAGLRLEPYRNEDGKFIVSETKFADDHIFVDSLADVAEHVRSGYKVRMKAAHGGPASLIAPTSITIEVRDGDV
jgi:hypothetical protein